MFDYFAFSQMISAQFNQCITSRKTSKAKPCNGAPPGGRRGRGARTRRRSAAGRCTCTSWARRAHRLRKSKKSWPSDHALFLFGNSSVCAMPRTTIPFRRRNSAASEISSIPRSMWLPTSSTGPSWGTPARPLTTVPSSKVEYIAGQVLNLRSLQFVT